MGNLTSRTITGGAMIVLGIVLTGIGIFFLPVLFYGIPILILGVIIFFNEREDKIEQIKSKRRKKR